MIKKIPNSQVGRIFLIFLVLQLLFKLILISTFHDRDFEPDSYLHFLQIRTVAENFSQFWWMGLDVWAKPLYLYPLALLVKTTGINQILLVQIANIVLSTATIYTTFLISQKLFNEKVALISSILLTVSLLFFKSSVSALTESLFSLVLILALYQTSLKKYRLASLLFGLCLLARIEGAFFLAVYLAWLFFVVRTSKNWQKIVQLFLPNLLITLLPLLIWIAIGYWHFQNFSFIAGGYVTATKVYGHGHILAYPYKFLTQEPIITILFSISTLLLILKAWRKIRSERFDFLILIFLLTSGFIFLQMLFWSSGRFGSAGLMRYFVSIMPLMGIFSGLTIDRLYSLLPHKNSQLNYVMFTLVVISLCLTCLYFTNRFGKNNWLYDVAPYQKSADWLKQNVKTSQRVYYDRPEVIYYAGRDLTNSRVNTQDMFQRSGAIVVFSQSWSENDFGIKQSQLQSLALLLKDFNEIKIYQIK